MKRALAPLPLATLCGCAVGALFAVLENITEQVQILPHAITLTKNGAKDAKKIQEGSNFTDDRD